MSKDNMSKETDTQVSKKDTNFEVNYDVIASGPLYIDPRHKKPGYVYEFVADEGGQIHNKTLIGYTVVQDDITIGDNVAANTTKFGSAVTVQSKCGRLLVLMATTKENHVKYMKHLDAKQKEREAGMRRAKIAGVDESLQDFSRDPSNIVGYREFRK